MTATGSVSGESGPSTIGERIPGAGTNARFAPLAVLMLVGSSTLLIPLFASAHDTDGLGCKLAAGADPDHLAEVPSLSRMTAQARAFLACQAKYSPGQQWWQIGAVLAALVVVAALVLAALPRWRTRSRRLVPLEALRDAAAIRARLETLATGRVEPLPRVLVARTALTKGASVLGTNRRPRLRLDGALLAARDSERETFDAVVLHELGHIANRDLTVTFATVALWRAFIAVVLLPYLLLEGKQAYQGLKVGLTSTTASVQVRTVLVVPALIVGVVYFARADVLRSRELHADQTAHRWGAALDRVWDTRLEADQRRPGNLRGAVAGLLRTHPDWAVRRAALADPAPLFAVDRGLMFLTGATATLLSFQSTGYISWRLTLLSRWLIQSFAAVPAGLVSAVAGTVLWRAAARALVRGIPPPSGVRAGLWLGAGLVVGTLATGQVSGDLWLPRRPWVLLLAVLAAVAFTCWTVQCAGLAAVSWPGRTLRAPLAAGVVVGALAFAVWLAWWMSDGSGYANGYWYSTQGERQIILRWVPGFGAVHPAPVALFAWTIPEVWHAASPPLLPTAAVLVWLVPLAFWSAGVLGLDPGRRPGAGEEGAAARPSAVPPLRQAVRPGLLGAAGAVAAVVGIQGWLHTMQRGPDQRGGLYAFSYAAWSLGAVVLAAAVAAAFGQAAVRFRLVAALIAAGLTTLVGLAGTTVLMSVDGCVQPLSVLNSTCGWHPAWQGRQAGSGFNLLIHCALLLGPVTAALVWLAAELGRRVVRGPSATGAMVCVSRPSAQVAEPGPRRLTRSRGAAAAVGITAASALALAAVTTVVDAPAASARASVNNINMATYRLESGTRTLPVSADVRWRQVHAWYRLGGRYLLDHEAGDMHRLGTVIRSGVHGNQLAVTPSMMTRAEPICEDVFRVAGWEYNSYYFEVPDQAAETSWHRFADEAWNGSVNCVRAVRDQDVGGFTKAMVEMANAARDASAVRKRVVAVIDDPQDTVFKGQAAVPAH